MGTWPGSGSKLGDFCFEIDRVSRVPWSLLALAGNANLQPHAVLLARQDMTTSGSKLTRQGLIDGSWLQ